MYSQEAVDRFWSKVRKANGDKCWTWSLGRDKDGYGKFKVNGQTERAHRVAMKMSGLALGQDDCGLHRCDNPSCVRPDHLFVGTNADNMADKTRKGRLPSGCRAGGENNNSKLTERQVAEIRALYPLWRQAALADFYGVSQPAISTLVNHVRWKHVP